MKLNSNLYFFFIFSKILFGNVEFVSFGWEAFDYITDARSSALGNSNIAYKFDSPSSSIINPNFVNVDQKYISLTHQSRFAGLINNDLIGFKFGRSNIPFNINVFYQSIGKIPDTREMLLDWGLDGQFGTNDSGEGNGILDEGERLDKNKLSFFSQSQIGIHNSFKKSFFNQELGLAFKILGKKLHKHSALGVGIDLGILKKYYGINFAAVVKNFPSSGLLWDDGKIEGTMTKLSIGSHYNKLYKNLPFSINLMSRFDFDSILNGKNELVIQDIKESFGFEIVYESKVYIRFGRDVYSNLAGGLGLLWDDFCIDYAFNNSFSSTGIGNNHLITFNLNLDFVINYVSKL